MPGKIDLTLLNSLVKEVNNATAACEKMALDEKLDYTTYVIELAKLMGLMSGVNTESAALIADVVKVVKQSSVPPQHSEDFLAELLTYPSKAKKLD
jgi:hypothetical protein